MKRVCALTGAGGYVGSRIRHALEEHGWQVVPLSRSAAKDGGGGIRWSLEDSAANARALEAGLRERGVEALVHAAWDFSVFKPKRYLERNVGGSRALFGAAVAAGVRELVFISTISAYPGCKSMYGRAKLLVEELAAKYNSVVIRPGLVYGREPGGVYGALLRQVLKGHVVGLIGSGNYPQYLVFDEDLCEAVVQACKGDLKAGGGPLTIANPTQWAFKSLLLAIAKLQDRKIVFVKVPWRVVFGGLKLAESLGLRLKFRSDSVLSLVHQNPMPDFSGLPELVKQPRPFAEGLLKS